MSLSWLNIALFVAFFAIGFVAGRWQSRKETRAAAEIGSLLNELDRLNSARLHEIERRARTARDNGS